MEQTWSRERSDARARSVRWLPFVVTAAMGSSRDAGHVTDDLDDIQVVLDDTGLPGLSLAYSVGSTPTVTRTWGVTSIDDPTPVSAKTIFQAGSVTKVVTAFAALRLAAAGRLELDADINSVLRSWQLPSVWGWQSVVTTRMLLAHVAGVSASWADGMSGSRPLRRPWRRGGRFPIPRDN